MENLQNMTQFMGNFSICQFLCKLAFFHVQTTFNYWMEAVNVPKFFSEMELIPVQLSMALPSSVDLALTGLDFQQIILQELWFIFHVLMTTVYLTVSTSLLKQLMSSVSFSAQEFCVVDAKMDLVQFWGVQSAGSVLMYI